jgi:hypothetical protein
VAVVAVMALNAPQAPALPHVTDHVTPLLAESFVTTAVSGVVALVSSEAGGAGLRATEIALMEMVAEADFVVSVTDVAVTVTVLPVGAAAGAV